MSSSYSVRDHRGEILHRCFTEEECHDWVQTHRARLQLGGRGIPPWTVVRSDTVDGVRRTRVVAEYPPRERS